MGSWEKMGLLVLEKVGAIYFSGVPYEKLPCSTELSPYPCSRTQLKGKQNKTAKAGEGCVKKGFRVGNDRS